MSLARGGACQCERRTRAQARTLHTKWTCSCALQWVKDCAGSAASPFLPASVPAQSSLGQVHFQFRRPARPGPSKSSLYLSTHWASPPPPPPQHPPPPKPFSSARSHSLPFSQRPRSRATRSGGVRFGGTTSS
eukprot:6179088-Pleurochrysis_carterae.AAC.1